MPASLPPEAVFVRVYMCTYGGGLHADLRPVSRVLTCGLRLHLSLLLQLFLWMVKVNWVW